jgi:hypothetical protein
VDPTSVKFVTSSRFTGCTRSSSVNQSKHLFIDASPMLLRNVKR